MLERTRSLKRHFLDRHLGRWVSPFAAAMRGNAQSAFYRTLADLTEMMVKQEAARA